MKKILAILAVTLMVFLAAATVGGSQKGDLQVIYNLSGDLQNLVVNVNYNSPLTTIIIPFFYSKWFCVKCGKAEGFSKGLW
jgi:hypothetical protein